MRAPHNACMGAIVGMLHELGHRKEPMSIVRGTDGMFPSDGLALIGADTTIEVPRLGITLPLAEIYVDFA